MSFELDLDNFLYRGGEMPNLAEGTQEVSLPKGFYVCVDCKKVTNYFKYSCQDCEELGEIQYEESRGN